MKEKQSRESRTSSWFERHPVLTFSMVAIVFVALLEVLFRMFFGHLFAPSEGYVEHNPLTHHDLRPSSVHVRRPSKFDSFTPVTNRINAYGVRGPELGKKKTYRVLCIGDSFVQADEVEFEDTFGERLNRYFNGKIEFISHGAPSWSPTTCASWIYHKGLALDPDEIDLFVCVNDFYRAGVYQFTDQAYRRKARYEGNIPVGYEIRATGNGQKGSWSLLDRSLVFKLLRRGAVKALRVGKGWVRHGDPQRAPSGMNLASELVLLSEPDSLWPNDLRENVDETIDVILQLNEFLRGRNVRLNVLMATLGFAWADETVPGKQHPTYGWSKDKQVSQQGIELYVRDRLVKVGVNWIDLRHPFEQAKLKDNRLLFYEEDGHWNPRGHEVVFEVLRAYYDRESRGQPDSSDAQHS